MTMKQRIKWLLIFNICLCIFFLVIGGVLFYTLPSHLLVSSTAAQKEAETKSLFAMDTYITLTAYGQNAASALDAAGDRLIELEQLWSVTQEGSDIYAINHSSGQTVPVHSETEKLIDFALSMARETNGALEPTIYPVLRAWGFTTGKNRVPDAQEITDLLKQVDYTQVQLRNDTVQLPEGMMLDLGAVGKGFAGDLLVQTLKEHGVTSALLDIGGNVQALGGKADGSAWRLGLRDPFSEGTLGVMEIRDTAVVTSGNYERYFIGDDGEHYGHIIDPKTGYPSNSGVASVTVIARDGRLCDALSTALFVMGVEQAESYWLQHQNFEMLMVSTDGEIIMTQGIAESFSLNSYYDNMPVRIIER